MTDYPTPNSVGIYETAPVCASYRSKTHTMARVSVDVIETAKDEWRAAYQISAVDMGMGFSPGVTDPIFPDKQTAIYAMIQDVKKHVTSWMARTDYSESNTNLFEARKIIDWCDSFKQLTLF